MTTADYDAYAKGLCALRASAEARAQRLVAELRQRPQFAGHERIVLACYRRVVRTYPEMPAEVALQVAYRQMLRRRTLTATPSTPRPRRGLTDGSPRRRLHVDGR